MGDILEIARRYGCAVVEDAAHAFPSKMPEGYAGTLGDIGVYSFYATKTITTGDGGMVVTRDDRLAKRMSSMRMHGIDRQVWDRYTSKTASWRYSVVEAGFKYNLPTSSRPSAANSSKKRNGFFRKKNHRGMYRNAFAALSFVNPLPTARDTRASVLVAPDAGSAHGGPRRLHRTPAGIRRRIFRAFHSPSSDAILVETLRSGSGKLSGGAGLVQPDVSLPIWQGMSTAQARKVVSEVTRLGESFRA
jgi:dTDP-4-amino-4,6-dideoxygalactose transaminase